MVIKNEKQSKEARWYHKYQRDPLRHLDFQNRRILGLVSLVAVVVTFLHQLSISFDQVRPLKNINRIDRAKFDEGLKLCDQIHHHTRPVFAASRENPRWNSFTGQNETIILRNATLFDGDLVLDFKVDIIFDKGIIKSVLPASESTSSADEGRVWNLDGKFITPGLVDMHSHHLLIPFPQLPSTTDVNEKPQLGSLTPFVRAIDGFKPYDPATAIIASGGVTSSLVLPGSGNIIGGEAYMVKNSLVSGPNREPVVDEILLDYGVRPENRQRYMKMACGENPKHLYGHTRMGNAWLLREHLARAKKLQERQDEWCYDAAQIQQSRFGVEAQITKFITKSGGLEENLELESSLAMLRGNININIHCYEPEDIERMLSICHEFGIQPHAFHHALEAWQVPELLRKQGGNVTIATFADNAFFKHEAYGANLRAGKILSEQGVPVAFKSDHVQEQSNAKYLMFQASTAHKFGMAEDKALKSVTSVPARSVQQDHRIGYVRSGYDADIVIWNSHPLDVGATALQVFIDGVPNLNPQTVAKSLGTANKINSVAVPSARPQPTEASRQEFCENIESKKNIVFTGINGFLLDSQLLSGKQTRNLTMVVSNGQISCIDTHETCVSEAKDGVIVPLQNGYVTPGLISVGQSIGLSEISGEDSTGDGRVSTKTNEFDERNVDYAKYGVHFEGRLFKRARIGGLTRAITPPLSRGGLLPGVSVGIRTTPTRTILDGGIFQDDVALHVVVGQSSKQGESTTTISSAISHLRRILSEAKSNDSIYTQALNGTLPLVVHAVNKYDILQIIRLQNDFTQAKFVIYGAHEAPSVAKELAKAHIPVILTGNRGAPDKWEKKNALAGPPLTRSPADILTEEGVTFGLAIQGDSHIYALASEAGWAAQYAGLSEKEAIALVSTNIEDILHLASSKATNSHGDLVVWEGNPLRGEGSVVVTFEDDGRLGVCWPQSD